MIHTTQDFLQWWASEASNTSELFGSIGEEQLHNRLVPNERTIAEMIWHMLVMPKYLLRCGGCEVVGPDPHSPPAKSITELLNTHDKLVKTILQKVHKEWDDASLDKTARVGNETWRRRDILLAILLHHIHHRGQLSILMRLGGCDVPPIYDIKTS